MLTQVHHPATERRLAWRQVLTVQANRIAAAVLGREADYQAVIWR